MAEQGAQLIRVQKLGDRSAQDHTELVGEEIQRRVGNGRDGLRLVKGDRAVDLQPLSDFLRDLVKVRMTLGAHAVAGLQQLELAVLGIRRREVV